MQFWVDKDKIPAYDTDFLISNVENRLEVNEKDLFKGHYNLKFPFLSYLFQIPMIIIYLY